MDMYLTASQFGKYPRLATSTSVNNCYTTSHSLPNLEEFCHIKPMTSKVQRKLKIIEPLTEKTWGRVSEHKIAEKSAEY